MTKVISIGTDRKIFEEGSSVRQRNIEYGKFFDQTHVVVFTTRIMNYESRIKISDNVFAYATNSSSKLFYVFDAFFIIKKLFKNFKLKIKNSRSDCIVTAGDSFETGLVGVLAKLFFGLPLHVQVHTDPMRKYFRSLSVLNRLRFLVSEFVLKYADRVRVVSERVKKSIESFSKNIDVLPIKMEIAQGSALEIKKPFPFTLLMVCRMEKEKNIEAVLQVVKNLENNEGIGLCIVGDGSEKESLELLAGSLGLKEKVKFVGWQNDLAPYYKMADVFISASLYEGYGVSTVEAAHFGKPLILSETGVAGDLFKEGASVDGNYGSALVCDAKDSACFSQNILKIYGDRNLAQKMGQSAKISADKHLNAIGNYFKEYADSVLKTADGFKSRNFISRIYDFKKTVFNSFIALRYLICGFLSSVINIGVLYIFTDIAGIWYLYSSVVAFLASLVVSFVLQKFVVFKDMNKEKIRYQFSRFSVVAILGIITNTILIFILVDFFGVWYVLSQIFAGLFVMFQNFILYKFFIFNKNK